MSDGINRLPKQRHTETKNAPEPGEQHALRHELPDQATPPGAERHTNGDLLSPYRRARQQQIRDVRARDEQDQRDDDHQHEQRPFEFPAKARPACGRRLEAHELLGERAAVARGHGTGEALFQPPGQIGLKDRVRLCRCACLVCPRPQPADDAPARNVPPAHEAGWSIQQTWHQTIGPPDVRIGTDLDTVKTSGRDAHNRERNVVDRDRAADDLRVAPEASRPESVAEHGSGDRSAHIIVTRGPTRGRPRHRD